MGRQLDLQPPGQGAPHHEPPLEEEHGSHAGRRSSQLRYVATACASYGLDFTNKIRRALTIGGPTFIHVIDPCPKGWDYDPKYSHELGMLAVETGLWVQYEIADGELSLSGPSRAIGNGVRERKPVRDYLQRQGRFAHLNEEDLEFFQSRVDDSWEKWWIPGIVPFSPPEE